MAAQQGLSFGSFSSEEAASIRGQYNSLSGTSVVLPARPLLSNATVAPPTPTSSTPMSWAARLSKGLPSRPPPSSPARAPVSSEDALSILDAAASAPLSSSPLLIPRGLVNTGNMCFMHAILQPLIFCPPFSALLRRLDAHQLEQLGRTPLLTTLAWFAREFSEIPDLATWRSTPLRDRVGASLTPHAVHEAVRRARGDVAVGGRQEDAEEFLGFILAILQDEVAKARPSASNGSDARDTASSGDWVAVGKRNRLAVTRDVDERVDASPIFSIFGGKLSSVVKSRGKPSVTLQPFFVLPLDISVRNDTKFA